MLGRIVNFNNVSVAPWVRVRRRMGPVQVVSLLDTVLILEAELCWWWLFVLTCGVHNITEILNIPSSIESIYFLRFHLACFSCFRTAQTTANNRHVFRVDKLPNRPPRFHIPRHFLHKVLSIYSKNFVSVFWLKFKVSWPESFEERVNEWYAVGTYWPSSISLESLNDPSFRMFRLCRRQKSPQKKIKKITGIFLYLFFRNACVTSSAIWTFHPVLNISIFIIFFVQKTGKYDKTHFEKVNPTNCWVDPGSQQKRSTF